MSWDGEVPVSDDLLARICGEAEGGWELIGNQLGDMARELRRLRKHAASPLSNTERNEASVAKANARAAMDDASKQRRARAECESLFKKAVLSDDFSERARLWKLYQERSEEVRKKRGRRVELNSRGEVP